MPTSSGTWWRRASPAAEPGPGNLDRVIGVFLVVALGQKDPVHRSFPLLLAVPVVLTGCTGSASPAGLPAAAPSASAAASAAANGLALRRPALDGDVDGDGKTDAVSTTTQAVSVRLSASGRTVTAPVQAAWAAPAVSGVHDVDRDGRAEVFVKTGQGASTAFYTAYRFDGTSLRVLQLRGQSASLGAGGSATHGDGFRCTQDGRLVVTQALSSDGSSYTVTAATYRLDTTELVLLSKTRKVVVGSDPSVNAAYAVDCGTVGD